MRASTRPRPSATSRSARRRSEDGMKVHVDDVDLYFDVAGAKRVPVGTMMVERPTLVLLHGGPGFDHSIWADTVGPLSEWAQVVVYDHRGNGRSDAGPHEKWTLQ